MKDKKYLAGAVLCATAIFSLVGCSQKETTNTESETQEIVEEEKEAQSLFSQENAVIDADFCLEQIWGDLYLCYRHGLLAKNTSDEVVFSINEKQTIMDAVWKEEKGYEITTLQEAVLAKKEYLPVTGDVILNRRGKAAFSIKGSKYAAICYTGCLDAGYILCARRKDKSDEDTWEYVAVSMADGQEFVFDGSDRNTPGCNQVGAGAWYYGGNGYFFRYQESDGSIHFFDLNTHAYYDAYSGTGDSEDDFAGFPNLTHWTYDNTAYGVLQCQADNQIYYMDLVSGCIEVENWQSEQMESEIEGYTNIVLKGKFDGGSKLIVMEDEEGNPFIGVLDENDVLLFDPLPGVDAEAINEKAFLVQNLDGEYWICNLSGKPKIRMAKERFLAGQETILFWSEDGNYHLFAPESDTILDLDAATLPENAVCSGFGIDGHYVFTTPEGGQATLLDEKGNLTWLHES